MRARTLVSVSVYPHLRMFGCERTDEGTKHGEGRETDVSDLIETKVAYFMDHKKEFDAPVIFRNPSIALSETTTDDRDTLHDIINNLRVSFRPSSFFPFLLFAVRVHLHLPHEQIHCAIRREPVGTLKNVRNGYGVLKEACAMIIQSAYTAIAPLNSAAVLKTV